MDSKESLCRAIPQCLELANNTFVRVYYSGTLIRAAVTCQWAAHHCIGSSATLPAFIGQQTDSNEPLNSCNDRHADTTSNPTVERKIRVTSPKYH